METIQTKCCSKCGVEKPATTEYFYIYKRNSDGFRSVCKICCIEDGKKYSKSENGKITKKKYKKSDKGIIQNKKWNSSENKKNAVKKHKSKIDKNDPLYKWNTAIHKHLYSISSRKDFTKIWEDIRDVYNMYGIKHHIDHKIPKSWFNPLTPKNIVNDLRNLQVIDAKYNQSKQDRWSDPVCDDYKEIILPYIKNQYLKSL